MQIQKQKAAKAEQSTNNQTNLNQTSDNKLAKSAAVDALKTANKQQVANTDKTQSAKTDAKSETDISKTGLSGVTEKMTLHPRN